MNISYYLPVVFDQCVSLHSYAKMIGGFIVLLSILALFLYLYYKKHERYFKLGHRLPGVPYLLTLKLYFSTRKSPVEIFHLAVSLSNKYSKVIRVWMGPTLAVALYNPEDVEIILSSNVHLEKSVEYKFFEPWFGNGLLISKGDTWRNHRKMIAPTFHMNILKSFIPAFNTISRNLCKKMEKEVGKIFDCHEYMSGVTVDILLDTVMGYKEPRSDDSGFEYAMAVMKMCNILHQRAYKPWLRYDNLFTYSKYSSEHDKLLNLIHDLTNKAVDYRKSEHLQKSIDAAEVKKSANLQEEYKLKNSTKDENAYSDDKGLRDDLDDNDENDVGEKKRLAFLDALTQAALQEGVNFTEQEVRDQVSTIMFEGHDTTAAGSSFVLCMMGIHQDIQAKVLQELDDILQKSDRPITYADTLEMKLLERVILESLRMYPPVPVIARKVNEDVKLASGDYTIPAGSTVVIAQYVLHRNPIYYENPNIFNPDNFLPEKCQARHFYSFIPFSAGPRSCVGRKYAMLKLKVLLATILRKYKITSPVSESEFKLQGDIILKRADGFRIQIEERQRA